MLKDPKAGLLLLVFWLGFAGAKARAQNFSDLFQDRQLLTNASAVVLGSNTNATEEPSEPLHAGKVGGHSVWISWLAPDNGLLTLSTLGSSFDTLLGLYTLRPGTNSPMQRLREVGGDDDGTGAAGPGGVRRDGIGQHIEPGELPLDGGAGRRRGRGERGGDEERVGGRDAGGDGDELRGQLDVA